MEAQGRSGLAGPFSPPRGFCFFNSVAIACRQLQEQGKASKILIVDWVGPHSLLFRSKSPVKRAWHQKIGLCGLVVGSLPSLSFPMYKMQVKITPPGGGPEDTGKAFSPNKSAQWEEPFECFPLASVDILLQM